MDADLFRVYQLDDLALDGYPYAWRTIKDRVRDEADHRCVRCCHPYRSGEHGTGEWSPCDLRCTHGGPVRYRALADGEHARWQPFDLDHLGLTARDAIMDEGPSGTVARYEVESAWRILTVHHLNGIKSDCRWWNLASLCQRCHLCIQGRVRMEQVYPYEHTEWFKPHAAGYYASVYLGEELTRAETVARMDELLRLEHVA